MAKVNVDFREFFAQTVDALDGDGALLVAQGADGKPNAMTIGWGTVGVIWGRPIFVVLVRPSRYTQSLMEQSGDFTVNVMPLEMGEDVAFCGEVSGRDRDKFAERGLQLEPSTAVGAPGIAQASLIYECRQVQKVDVDPETFAPAVRSRFYAKGDFHRVYFGEILACRAEEGFGLE